MHRYLLLAAVVLIAGCREDDVQVEKMVRGLKTHLVAQTEDRSIRRFPAVLEAAELTTVSFEVSGKLEQLTLGVGQVLVEGQPIARLDPTSLQLQVETAAASVAQAEAAAENAQATYDRQRELLQRGATTRVSVDDAQTQADSPAASLDQARKSLESAQQNLDKAVLTAPFDAIVNSVDVQSFTTVGVGAPIATIYPSGNFEVTFSVNFDVVNQLVVGKEAEVRLADRPDIVLKAVVSEIGSRADAVSSFPIVLQLVESNPLLKAGMAVEASISFPLAAAEGLTIPLTAAIMSGISGTPAQAGDPAQLPVYSSIPTPRPSSGARSRLAVSVKTFKLAYKTIP